MNYYLIIVERKINQMNRDHVKDILPEKLENYMKEFEEDMKLNEDNIHDKSMQRSAIAAKWARYCFEEERFKKKMTESVEQLKEAICQKLYEKKKDSIVNLKTTDIAIKLEAEKHLKKSSQYLKIKDELDNQDDIIRFIMEAKQIISGFGFDIKNSIEVLKLENI